MNTETSTPSSVAATPDDAGYRQRVRAWVLYDVANSSFVTTVVAAVFPIYYAEVAGATLPDAATATQYFAITTSISLAIVAIMSPLLGSYSDLSGGKKRILAGFMGAGATATGALVLVGEGDWLLASVLFVIGRIGFGGANIMYDSLLPHVARPEDQDRVSSRGFAFGYFGGGFLLAINVLMVRALPDGNLGVRLSFVTVALWWALFSLPLLLRVPEPPTHPPLNGADAVGLRSSLHQVKATLADLLEFGELRRFLIAFLIYNDGINAIVAVAAIYGTELGFEGSDLILAILLIQFAGLPYSLLWGKISACDGFKRGWIVSFLLLNILLVPVIGLGGAALLPGDIAGTPDAALLIDGESVRQANLGFILGLLFGLQAVAAALSAVLAPITDRVLASKLDTRSSIILTLVAYAIVAIWGFSLDSVIEFWSLAWMVGVAQGGSQALSRSLYASLCPRTRTGEFFGLFSILSKAASVISPLFFALSIQIFGQSRPAMLAVGAMFLIGIHILRGLDIERGRKTAATADAFGGAASGAATPP